MMAINQLSAAVILLLLASTHALVSNNHPRRMPSAKFPSKLSTTTESPRLITTTTALHGIFFESDSCGSPPIDDSHSRSINNRHSAGDWLYNVRSLPKSSVLKEIRNPVMTIAAWSTVLSVMHHVMQKSSLTVLQKLARNMCIGSTPHSFLVSSLGLLLVFRTNSAYQRFYVSTCTASIHYTGFCGRFSCLNLSGGSQDLGEYFIHFSESGSHGEFV